MDVKTNLKCEVLVVGGGNSGLVASIEARNRGAKVVLLEKAPKKTRGGNSRLSNAYFRVATESQEDIKALLEGVELLKEAEIETFSKDEFYNKVMKLSDGYADKRFTEIYVSRSLEAVMWMKGHGVQWDLNPEFAFKKGNHLYWPNHLTFLQAKGSGEGLVEMLYKSAESKGVNILYDTAAWKLTLDGSAKVCGVIAKTPEGLIQIETNHVILTCGGFQANPQMRASYLGTNWDLVRVRGTRYDTGDGILMAQEIGASVTGHWGGCHASVLGEDSPMVEAASSASERYSFNYSITINRNGKRFIDEGENVTDYIYAKFGREILKQPGSVAFQIFDKKVFPLLRKEYQDALRVETNSIEEMAEELDINGEDLLSTISAFNRAIVNDEKEFSPHECDGRHTKGLTPDKTNWALKIDAPPYRAYAVVCGLTMTYGGLKTNEKAQVIDTSDRPIKGVYAVGELTGGYFYNNYPGGTGLTRGAVMGRIAGKEAVTNL